MIPLDGMMHCTSVTAVRLWVSLISFTSLGTNEVGFSRYVCFLQAALADYHIMLLLIPLIDYMHAQLHMQIQKLTIKEWVDREETKRCQNFRNIDTQMYLYKIKCSLCRYNYIHLLKISSPNNYVGW